MVPVPCMDPFGTAVERVGTFYYTRTQKREILESPGLQHVPFAPKGPTTVGIEILTVKPKKCFTFTFRVNLQ